MTTLSNRTMPATENKAIRNKAIGLAVGLAGLAFLANPNGPLGGFWPPSMDFPAPTTG